MQQENQSLCICRPTKSTACHPLIIQSKMVMFTLRIEREVVKIGIEVTKGMKIIKN